MANQYEQQQSASQQSSAQNIDDLQQAEGTGAAAVAARPNSSGRASSTERRSDPAAAMADEVEPDVPTRAVAAATRSVRASSVLNLADAQRTCRTRPTPCGARRRTARQDRARRRSSRHLLAADAAVAPAERRASGDAGREGRGAGRAGTARQQRTFRRRSAGSSRRRRAPIARTGFSSCFSRRTGARRA